MFQNIIQIVKSKLFFNDSKWRRMALSCSKKISALLREITSKHHGDFYCLNCLHCFATENKRESHKIVFENKDFRNTVLPSEDTKLLEFNQLMDVKIILKIHPQQKQVNKFHQVLQ